MTSSFTLLKLHFKAGIHIGSGGFGEESTDDIISSDRLFSAICSATQFLYGDTGVEILLKDNAVQLSSAFPFLRDELFFPKPLSYVSNTIQKYSDRKVYKKVKYVPKDYFEQMIAGNDFNQPFQSEYVLQSCWLKNKPTIDLAIYHRYEMPRVALDRITNASTIFHFSEIRFTDNAGFFFLSSFADDSTKNIFMASLRLLGDEGIGADRTIGKGWFEVTEQSLSLNIPDTSNNFVLLSQYAPTADEIESMIIEASYYDLAISRGWVTASGGKTLRRQSVNTFIEGSVITFNGDIVPKGKNVKVLLKEKFPVLRHDIYRNFQALAIPIILRKNENG